MIAAPSSTALSSIGFSGCTRGRIHQLQRTWYEAQARDRLAAPIREGVVRGVLARDARLARARAVSKKRRIR
jgi:hypothetical protein